MVDGRLGGVADGCGKRCGGPSGRGRGGVPSPLSSIYKVDNLDAEASRRMTGSASEFTESVGRLLDSGSVIMGEEFEERGPGIRPDPRAGGFLKTIFLNVESPR